MFLQSWELVKDVFGISSWATQSLATLRASQHNQLQTQAIVMGQGTLQRLPCSAAVYNGVTPWWSPLLMLADALSNLWSTSWCPFLVEENQQRLGNGNDLTLESNGWRWRLRLMFDYIFGQINRWQWQLIISNNIKYLWWKPINCNHQVAIDIWYLPMAKPPRLCAAICKAVAPFCSLISASARAANKWHSTWTKRCRLRRAQWQPRMYRMVFIRISKITKKVNTLLLDPKHNSKHLWWMLLHCKNWITRCFHST